MTISRLTALGTSLATVVLTTIATLPAHAADSDGDQMPDAWEIANGLKPNIDDADKDKDHDDLLNLAEYRKGADPQDDDTDGDGYDDGEEVSDGSSTTNLLNKDTDADGTRDGDEDLDGDGVTNEDEDDADETCKWDDGDEDNDHVADEDENELGLNAKNFDTNENGITDGSEDKNHDGETNEDEDDSPADLCANDVDADGENDEDRDDLLGVIASYDPTTRVLSATTASSGLLTWTLASNVDVQWNNNTGETEGPANEADLFADMNLHEIELDDAAGLITSLEITPGSLG